MNANQLGKKDSKAARRSDLQRENVRRGRSRRDTLARCGLFHLRAGWLLRSRVLLRSLVAVAKPRDRPLPTQMLEIVATRAVAARASLAARQPDQSAQPIRRAAPI